MIDLEMTNEQKDLVETVRNFAAKEFAPFIGEADQKGTPISGTFQKLTQMGLPGICIPAKYGGSGMDYVSLGLACEEMEYVDTSLRTILSIHVGLCSLGIYQWGSEEQKQEFLVPLAKGERFGAFGLTEPDAGSDVAGLKSTARKDGNFYILNGSKMWISGADLADTFLVFAYTDKERKHNGISAFIVERSNAGSGFSTFSIKDKAGIKAGNGGGMTMQDVKIPAKNLLGQEGEGFKIAMSCLDNGRYTVGAGATGLIHACLDASVKYAKERKAFGKAIGEFQLVQEMIARMVANYDASRLLYWKAGWLKNGGIRATRESALCKWFATVSAFQAASDAVEIYGAYGYSDEYPVARFLRNAKGSVIYEGTQEIQKLIQGEYAMGIRQDRPVRCPLPPHEEYSLVK
ncbi:MAG: acyl-CoA dehydrogenase family protein [Armatimonadetes bacterium]|nr:acyl-CoA dehydrogenase family protein [Armatimonadota bacterium]